MAPELIYVLSIELMLLTTTFLSTVEGQPLLLIRFSSIISSSIFTMMSMSYYGNDENIDNDNKKAIYSYDKK